MSRKIIITLVVMAVVCAAVAAWVVVPPALRSDRGNATPQPLYAYIASKEFVLIRGDQVLARVEQTFDPFNPNPAENKIVWTNSGNYVAFFSEGSLKFVDTRSGTVGYVPCPGCDDFAAVGDNDILALDFNHETTPVFLGFNLDRPGPGIPHETTGLPLDAQWYELLGISDRRVLVNVVNFNDENYMLLDATGSLIENLGLLRGSTGQVIASVGSASGFHGFVITSSTDPGGCGSPAVIAMLDLSTYRLTETDLSEAAPPNYVPEVRGSIRVEDIWWGIDGHLRAMIHSYDCERTDALSRQPRSEERGIWRLDGTTWVSEGSSSANAVRALDQNTSITLTKPDCSKPGVGSDPTVTCGAGDLHLDRDGEEALIADSVLAISTPLDGA